MPELEKPPGSAFAALSCFELSGDFDQCRLGVKAGTCLLAKGQDILGYCGDSGLSLVMRTREVEGGDIQSPPAISHVVGCASASLWP